jgi:hypothetical protein
MKDAPVPTGQYGSVGPTVDLDFMYRRKMLKAPEFELKIS